MNILIVAATHQELKPLFEKYKVSFAENVSTINISNHTITALITGVGMVATTFHLTKLLSINNSYDLAINAGIAGSFFAEINIGEVVNVVDEHFGDIGAEDGEEFSSLFDMGFLKQDDFPFMNGKLVSEYIFENDLRDVSGLTVNKVHGNEVSIEKAKKKFNVSIESMEGAAFAYCCAQYEIPWIEIRSISNFIEQRDKNKWNIPLAINNLNDWLIKFIAVQ